MEATGKLSKEGLSPKEFTATKEHATLDGETFYGNLVYVLKFPMSQRYSLIWCSNSIKEDERFCSFRRVHIIIILMLNQYLH